jgi:hypothetical protein
MTAGRYDALGTVAFAKDNEARRSGCVVTRVVIVPVIVLVVLAGSETATGDVD